ncbi:TVP38/TMEM64 family protein [Oleidesulfovibrio sp.]|uniref:TVP38/TMEM64 family protein n=1 Tax=Oleidesulfovibrio sp. TaxID=2909707 RepID=UPI003A899AA5
MKPEVLKRLALVAVVVLFVGIFLYNDWGRFFTLEYVKQSQADFAVLYAEKGMSLIAVYMAIYIVVTALSLPGATVMTLAGAALFGFWATLVAVSFASTIGATLACLASRFVFRDWVQRRFADRLMRINDGIRKDGAFYLFSLRLVPVFPFFLINLAMGLTPIRVTTFYWVSQLGMLPGTVVYVNAGSELGAINSLSGILSPSLLFSFALLGIFPLAARKVLERVATWRGKKENIDA